MPEVVTAVDVARWLTVSVPVPVLVPELPEPAPCAVNVVAPAGVVPVVVIVSVLVCVPFALKVRELGEKMHVPPVRHPDVTVRLTVTADPPLPVTCTVTT